jgi:hypothetical protein
MLRFGDACFLAGQLDGLDARSADVKLKVRVVAVQPLQRVLQSWSKNVVFAVQTALEKLYLFRVVQQE